MVGFDASLLPPEQQAGLAIVEVLGQAWAVLGQFRETYGKAQQSCGSSELNTCLSGRSHSSKSDLVSSLGLASGRALLMRSEFRLGLPCRREFARVAAQIFSGTLNSIPWIIYPLRS